MKVTLVFLAVMSLIAFSYENITIPVPDDADLEETVGNSAVSVDITDPFGNGGNPDVGIVYDDPSENQIYVTTLLNTWQITYAPIVQGMDYLILGSTPVIGFCSSVDESLYFANITDMTMFNVSGLHSNNIAAYGCTVTPPVMTTTDYFTSDIFEGLWSNWNTYSNPGGSDTRGITADGNNSCLWLTMTTGTPDNYVQNIGSMTQGNPGSIVWYDISDELNGTRFLSGLTDFILYNGNTCLAYIIFNSGWVRFHEFTGSGLTYLGYAVLPASAVTSSLGICYCSTRDSFYWSYKKNSNFYVSEFSVDITALNHSTWGQIKASF